MSTLVLPHPSLVVLIGAAGSGKSTLAARLFAPDEILSSDALRATVSGNEADQRASAVAFRILHRTLERRLSRDQLTVIDATNTKPDHRRPLLIRARATATPTIAIVLDLPPTTVLTQNTARANRVVDPSIVHRHLTGVRQTVDDGALAAEGFDHVVLLRSTTDIQNLRIERRETGVRRVAPNGRR